MVCKEMESVPVPLVGMKTSTVSSVTKTTLGWIAHPVTHVDPGNATEERMGMENAYAMSDLTQT